MLSLFQLHGVSSRKCKLLLLSCCAAGDLLDIFPFLSSQTMPAQERTARCLKAPMENMKIILGSSGVRSSVCSVERKGRVAGVSSPYIWSNKQSVSWMCWCEWLPSKGPAKCSLWSALGPPAIYPSMVLPCICFSGQRLSFCMCSYYSFHRLPIKSILTFTAIFPKVFSANTTFLPLRANGRSDFRRITTKPRWVFFKITLSFRHLPEPFQAMGCSGIGFCCCRALGSC